MVCRAPLYDEVVWLFSMCLFLVVRSRNGMSDVGMWLLFSAQVCCVGGRRAEGSEALYAFEAVKMMKSSRRFPITSM